MTIEIAVAVITLLSGGGSAACAAAAIGTLQSRPIDRDILAGTGEALRQANIVDAPAPRCIADLMGELDRL